eukprot:5733681-Ditylum_brightwellii.AAC.1
MTHCNAASTDCDVKSCYNRVIPEIAALAQYQAGLPDQAATFFLQALKQMKYHMVTSYGVDEVPVKSTKVKPIYRIGQGATDAPQNWTLVSNTCQKAYEKHAKGCTITDPTQNIILNANGKMFVDDKNLLHTGSRWDTPATELMHIVTGDLSL